MNQTLAYSDTSHEEASALAEVFAIPSKPDEALLEILPDLSRVVAHYFKSLDDREDMMQDLVAHILLKFNRFSGKSPFLNWCLRLTSNLCISKLRYKKMRRFLSFDTQVMSHPECPLGSPDNSLQDKEFQSITREAIESLKAKDRELILICDILQKSDREAADILSIKHSHLRVRKHRAHQKLKEELLKRGYTHD